MSETTCLKELLQLVRTGSFDEAKKIIIGLGAPEPSPEAKWSNEIGDQFLHSNQPLIENLHYIRFITLAAEIYDHFGAYHLAEQSLKGHNLQAEIDRDLDLIADEVHVFHHDTQLEKWKLLRQKLYFWLQVSRVAYRQNKYDRARECVQRCLNIAKAKLGSMSEGLAADVHFRLAAIARQESKLDDAIEFYGKCLAWAFERLKRKQKGSDPFSPGDTLAARYLIGKSSALGLGYCFLEKGMLREARMLITTGQMLLWETADQLNLQYCELLFARLLRHSAGRDPEKRELLNQADEILRRCLEVCGKHRRRFVYRVYYELGFVALYSGRFREAESNFKKVLVVAKGTDSRWTANAMIAMARLRFTQGQTATTLASELFNKASELFNKASELFNKASELFNKALAIAIDAEAIAKHAHQRWVQARAVLMQARAEMSLAMLPTTSEGSQKTLRRSARIHLESVLQMVDLANPAVRALPLILLARLNYSEGKVQQARSVFDAWLAIKDQVQYAAVRGLGEQVAQEVFPKKGDFLIEAGRPDEALNKKKLSLDLERYIFSRLEARKDLTGKEKAKIWGGGRPAYLHRRKQVMGF
jgi:tetratricopeptide (TPR) repeat protein